MRGVRHFGGWAIILMALAWVDARGQTFRLSQPERFKPYAFTIIGGVPGEFGHTDGVGTNALFGGTTGLATDPAGNLYIVDALLDGQTIRRMSPDGVVITLAGEPGSPGEVDGTGADARFYQPHAATVDESGNIYVVDSWGRTIRKVTPEGEVTTLAGLGLTEGSEDGTGAEARFWGPTGITLDKFGNLYVADQGAHTIRKVNLYGEVTTFAGKHLEQGTNDGPADVARFSSPRALTMGKNGNIYVADLGSGSIRRITPRGTVGTLATGFRLLTGIASDSAGNLYVVDSYAHVVNKVSLKGEVSTLVDERGWPIRFKFDADHSSIAIDKEDNIYVADGGDNTILKATATPNLIKFFVSAGTDPFFGRTAVIEASTNFHKWVPAQTNFASGGVGTEVIVTNAPEFPHRFFRARSEQRDSVQPR